ncbi:uncharacterized protein AMSG_11915 [Thecamonas trahens ATCC 50062]|uniref:Uncharacterized protein n=1 Tax=Thecamonas trahens ATCC 50062 TaxID=461836 RepID=A0A0L0DCP8_THETB|nr:hypothetical protein AMSG_11915 [Thecamonas trahens ATCC 50062]KNC50097.1 hypothetical protein AMSG_11915 [Thecamonas trahens ATCC 50062]|eukprot:XP_013757308.1 hypothetical protein AMSG_11915 [Thecamonas trahens ATCC 50062]
MIFTSGCRKVSKSESEPTAGGASKRSKSLGAVAGSSASQSEPQSQPQPQPQPQSQSQPRELEASMLDDFILRKIVKENHGSEVVGLEFNRVQADASNMVATVGANQLNVYDNEHIGDHLDIVSQYMAPDTEDSILCMAWADAPVDSLLVVGNSAGRVQVISLVNSVVIAEATVHSAAVTALHVPLTTSDHMLITASRAEGVVKAWSLPDLTPLASLASAAGCITSAAPAPHWAAARTAAEEPASDVTLVVGTLGGDIEVWDVPTDGSGREPVARGSLVRSELPARQHLAPIDCVRVISTTALVSKSTDGRLVVWQKGEAAALETAVAKCALAVEPPTPQAGPIFTSFDVSANGKYLAVGSAKTVQLISTETWSVDKVLEHHRVRTEVYTARFTKTGSSIIFSGSDAFIWRFDYFPPETADEKAVREAREARQSKIQFRDS